MSSRSRKGSYAAPLRSITSLRQSETGRHPKPARRGVSVVRLRASYSGCLDVKILDSKRSPDRFFAALRAAPTRLLVLDYDGTLAPFVAHAKEAVLYPQVDALLSEARAQGTILAFISGRPARDLAARLPFTDIDIFGAHGQEYLAASGQFRLSPLSAVVVAALKDIEVRIEAAGFSSAIERKHGTVAVHWRGLNERERQALQTLCASIETSLIADIEPLSFDGGYEFRVKGRDKGSALRELLIRYPDALVAYLGDDLTDEDAFGALPVAGLGVLVRSELRATRAHLWLEPPEDLRTFLSMWIRAITP